MFLSLPALLTGRTAPRRTNAQEVSSPSPEQPVGLQGEIRAANPSMVSPVVGTGDGLAGGEGSEPWLWVYPHVGSASSAALGSPAGMGSRARQWERRKPPRSPASGQAAAMQLKAFAKERLN